MSDRLAGTIAIVCYCPTCDYFIKTAVQVDAVGSHACMGCDGSMEVYVAQGAKEAVVWHHGNATFDHLRSAVRRLCQPLLIAARKRKVPLYDGEYFRGGFPPAEIEAVRSALAEGEWDLLTKLRFDRSGALRIED